MMIMFKKSRCIAVYVCSIGAVELFDCNNNNIILYMYVVYRTC